MKVAELVGSDVQFRVVGFGFDILFWVLRFGDLELVSP